VLTVLAALSEHDLGEDEDLPFKIKRKIMGASDNAPVR
jgi:hypothetical protein